MFKSLLIVLTAVVMLGAAPAPGGAQPRSGPDPAVWRELLEDLGPAPFVALRLADGAALTGTVVAVDADSFIIQPRTRIAVQPRTLRYEEVASMEPRKRPMSAGRKVITGIGVGVATYMLLVVIALSAGLD